MVTSDRHNRHASRSLDIIIHGATGFTGRRVVLHLAENHPSLNIAICGRSATKLNKLASELQWDESKSSSSVFVVPDALSEEGTTSICAAFSKAKIVIACAGPYRQCGLPILAAAIESRCDYLDLCGEPQFFDEALVAYDQKAREYGLLVIHAAAFDCVPAELGAALAERELINRFSCKCSGIEIIHTMQNVGSANATTFHAAVDGFYAASSGELSVSRNKVKEHFPEFDETSPPPRPGVWPKIPEQLGLLPGYNKKLGLRMMKFVGADASAIRSSWRYLRSRVPNHPRKGTSIPEPRLSVNIGMDANDKLSSLKVMAYGATFATLARWKWGCNMLHSYPEAFSGGVFTSKGPSEEELRNGRFTTYVTAYGPEYTSDLGNSQLAVHVKVSGPEPGYVATPALIVSLALTVLHAGRSTNGKVNLSFENGVTLPGALFGDCDIVYDYMRKEGVAFDVVDNFNDTTASPV